MKRLSIIIILLVIGQSMLAQFKKANDAFAHHHYEEAIELYNSVIRKDLDNDEAITNLAICYWKTDQYSLAEYWFQRAALMNDDPTVKLWYSQLLISNEKYDLAAEWLEKYAQGTTNPGQAAQARKMSRYCESLARGIGQKQECEVSPVAFNSDELDFAPVMYGDKLLFATNRAGVKARGDENDPWTKGRFTDIYMAPRTGLNQFEGPVPFAGEILTTWHEGPIAINPDGNSAVLTRSNVNDKRREFDSSRNTRLKLSEIAKNETGRWEVKDDFSFNSKEYNTAHATYSPDGSCIIFASDMPGGVGGMDLYQSFKQEDGSWTTPQNLGNLVNTTGNEIFPTLRHDGKLYFSSDMHLGFGGLDIYECDWTSKSCDNIDHLGAPINGPKDDFGILWDEDGKTGFFTSNRNAASKDDILFFQYTSNFTVTVKVIDCNNLEPVLNAQVDVNGDNFYSNSIFTDQEGIAQINVPVGNIYDFEGVAENYSVSASCQHVQTIDGSQVGEGDRLELTLALSPNFSAEYSTSYVCGHVTNSRYGNPLGQAVLVITNNCTGLSTELQTDVSGTYFVAIDPKCDYTLTAAREGFENFTTTFTPSANGSSCHELNIGLAYLSEELPALLNEDVEIEEGKTLELYHIYFDRDDHTIRENAIPDLETLLKILENNPVITGEIMAHTDSRASHDYNMDLSDRRAQSVQDWLVSKGINRERLTAVGYGETRLKNECSDGVPCTEKQHQRNRRVEFRVISADAYIPEVSMEPSDDNE